VTFGGDGPVKDAVSVHYRPSAPRGEDTRRRILETAIEAFAVDGYDAVSTRRLAERAGVNLPAIQYYFGSKEGLYRAAIDHIVRQIEERMAPIAARVNAVLTDGNPSRRELLGLLQELLDAFAALVVGGEHLESRRLLFARAEIERTAALDALHESGMRQVVEPCMALVGRLLGRAPKDDVTVLRTLLVLGQVTVFCNEGARRALGWADFSAERLRAIQALVREQTQAIFGARGGSTG
jgi:TetR/AcrR family transcriptional regulator, regulator of cefoperazone and chloramphenicol sensitivity